MKITIKSPFITLKSLWITIKHYENHHKITIHLHKMTIHHHETLLIPEGIPSPLGMTPLRVAWSRKPYAGAPAPAAERRRPRSAAAGATRSYPWQSWPGVGMVPWSTGFMMNIVPYCAEGMKMWVRENAWFLWDMVLISSQIEQQQQRTIPTTIMNSSTILDESYTAQ